jgi:hypothetical protein
MRGVRGRVKERKALGTLTRTRSQREQVENVAPMAGNDVAFCPAVA